jgi:hypothetical protein
MLSFLMAISCLIPFIISLIINKRIDKKIYPFVYTIWLAVITEVLVGLGKALHLDAIKLVVYNLFLFINFALILWFFTLQKLYTFKKAFIIFSIVSAINIVELIMLPHWSLIMKTSTLESVFIIMGFVQLITKDIFHNKTNPLKSFIFIISAATILVSLFDIYNTVLVWFLDIERNMQIKITIIYNTINSISYFIIAYALLCLPTKTKS